MTEAKIRGQREHWETPVCNVASLILHELRDDGLRLEILFDHGELDQSWRFRFLWQGYCAYRSTDEAQYIAWDLDPNDTDWRNTHKVVNSGWISELAKNNDLLAILYPNLQHFVICTSDYVTEVLSETEPLIQQWIDPNAKAATYEKSTYELVVPEPILFYAFIDEANFYRTLKDLPEVEHVTTNRTRTETEPNEVVLSLACEFLSDDSLGTVIGLLARYNMPMATLAGQHGQHNTKWFKDARKYWYEAVFGNVEKTGRQTE